MGRTLKILKYVFVAVIVTAIMSSTCFVALQMIKTDDDGVHPPEILTSGDYWNVVDVTKAEYG